MVRMQRSGWEGSEYLWQDATIKNETGILKGQFVDGLSDNNILTEIICELNIMTDTSTETTESHPK